jgi:cellulose biosynthesis protein BcsQ
MRQMFGDQVIDPALAERVVLQQAQGSATPIHLWPGDSAEEAQANFRALLERIEADVPLPV